MEGRGDYRVYAEAMGVAVTVLGEPVHCQAVMVDQAACADLPPQLWYPERGVYHHTAERAREVN